MTGKVDSHMDVRREDMTREQLIETINVMANQLDQYQSREAIRPADIRPADIRARALGMVEMNNPYPRQWRKLPERWEVGQKVRYVRDTDAFGPNKGNVGTICRIHPDYLSSPADEYGVLHVEFKKGNGCFWTDFRDIELAD